MDTLKINLENCYGIKQLNYDFDFSERSVYTIYAPNGTMKTSFAKTFSDFSHNSESKDLVFPARTTVRNIENEVGELSTEEVFVIEPYIQSFRSDRMSTLLVNKPLKDQYDQIHSDINEKKDNLIKELAKCSGLKKQVETELSRVFTNYSDEFFKAIARLKTEVLDSSEPEFSDIEYSRVFSDKIVAFLESKDFKEKLTDYMDKYDELIESSTYFRKGIFNHNNASTVAKNLRDNGFFQANHSVSLNSGSEKKEVTTDEELEVLIDEEKKAILNNDDLAKAFEEIDKKLKSNQELRGFRDYLMDNKKILPELSNLAGLKQKLWVSYLKDQREKYIELELEYSKGKEEIEKIVDQAKLEETKWRSVIEIFNKRFSVPFKLKVDNQEDVILKSDGPNIKFEFVDKSSKADVEEGDLLQILSNGEKRALYILNIIFEVEARKNEGQSTIFIVDDIADSFDYKNKYAIIEYLQDISTVPIFNQIILSHNYDFFRTVSSRLDMQRKHKLTTVKSETGIILKEEKYQNNPFSHWKDNLNTDEMLIASIPFVRNIAEFTGNEEVFIKLTSLLHIKSDTESLTKVDLQQMFRNVLSDKDDLILENGSQKVINLIFDVAQSIINDTSEIIELENKITLAIAIRLKAEKYMMSKIDDQTFCDGISKNQTFALFEKFKELFDSEATTIELLDQVNLMTPENIHLNSFMYEPILDMANNHLKELYLQLQNLD